MKFIKNILSILTIIFSILCLVKLISFDIALPLIEIFLATHLLLTGIESKQKGNKSEYIFNCLAALLVYIVVIYILFIG